MIMTETFGYFVAIITGLGLGMIFFYGLWRTVGKIINSNASGLWLFGSMISRISITMLGFYLIAFLHSDGKLERLILCLIGFLIARYVMTKIVKVKEIEVNHGP
jgi:F1F0 ATPase subunit 2